MTDLEINQKIAEAEFNLPVKRGTRRGKFDPEGVCLWYEAEHHGGEATWKIVPDYVNSLDAMREAEERLDDKQRRDYAFRLMLLLCHGSPVDLSEHFDLLHATARQRAEEFLKTIGEWKE